ncbi:PTS sugar transporter subunit IIA [Clostridium sp. KNHs214]|uniref:PTS sugar transporter subunit IIA n=1 Tax=Clostridium sp. KNHs214 TaxID=1540257 RepID=UPI00055274DA|nr:PTS sugar transporter subunit IIA [Clostridium sp. KNHs214]
MNLNDYFKKELIICNLEAENRDEVFEKMSNVLLKEGYVKESFFNGLVQREKVFPTGLTLTRYNVAIPHTDAEHVNTPAVALATLKKPVVFSNMCDMDEKVSVNVVFMMALNEPHSQVMMLQQLMGLIQDQDTLEKMVSAENVDEIVKIIEEINK